MFGRFRQLIPFLFPLFINAAAPVEPTPTVWQPWSCLASSFPGCQIVVYIKLCAFYFKIHKNG